MIELAQSVQHFSLRKVVLPFLRSFVPDQVMQSRIRMINSEFKKFAVGGMSVGRSHSIN